MCHIIVIQTCGAWGSGGFFFVLAATHPFGFFPAVLGGLPLP